MGLKSNLHNLKEKYKGTKMAPAFNAIHTFLYLPNEVTHNGTHVKAADDLKRTMNTVIMALVPCLILECLMQVINTIWQQELFLLRIVLLILYSGVGII